MQLWVWDDAALQLKHLNKSLGVTTTYGSEEQKHLCQKSPVFIAGAAVKSALRMPRDNGREQTQFYYLSVVVRRSPIYCESCSCMYLTSWSQICVLPCFPEETGKWVSSKT